MTLPEGISATPSRSWALVLRESLLAPGRLLGHSQVQTTARHAHLARLSVHEAARRILKRFDAALSRNRSGGCHSRPGSTPRNRRYRSEPASITVEPSGRAVRGRASPVEDRDHCDHL